MFLGYPGSTAHLWTAILYATKSMVAPYWHCLRMRRGDFLIPAPQMASSMVVLALIFSLISLILSSPVPKQQCSLEVTVSGRQVSILDVLKSHQCTPNATLYTGLRGVASKEELTVCTGLAALVSYGVEKNLKRFCSTASTKESLEVSESNY